MDARLRIVLADVRYAVRVACTDGTVIGWVATEQRLTLEGGSRTELAGLVGGTIQPASCMLRKLRPPRSAVARSA